jgi:hypothetical protein
MITAKIIEPKSFLDISIYEYEYCLLWYDDKGLPSVHLFEDFNINFNVDSENINLESDENIGNLVNDEVDTITLIAHDIKRNDINVYRSLFGSKWVYRLFPISTELEPAKVSIVGGRGDYKNSQQRLNFEIKIIPVKKAIEQ